MTEAIARIYRRFAEVEARDRSPVYAEIAAHVAGDADILGFLAGLPAEKWQPNLLFGAVQYLTGPVPGLREFRARFAAHTDEIRAAMLARTTQTNEPARCATLLPALAALPQPLALLEVGASAGLCLQPDRYGYDFGQVRIPGELVLPCRANDVVPLPARVPEVVWRAGLDLNPLDVRDPGDCAWLEALIWPGEEARLPRLRTALEIARRDPPPVHRGDLRSDFAALAAEAPRDATLVVFHTAVLIYLREPADRSAFAETVAASGAVWLANESPRSIPGVAAEHDAVLARDGFVLARDGEPIAWTDPHGTWIEWL
ncbi:DUF2332 domain-containing protein [Amycolatopsis acidiphila]|uniref:DUF2332 domain-containing protein n=1 Tax=Amycolatopsis acidiphila TaxID=715473 RepID=A0A558A8N8_9PSEU|nr:DUF2332 domain-containing protein [Amycolatopsis acidiphila]TVT20618.1 DUF2332 domain-containing protein [Amycolatopsis acidiphila]UIJ61385.1 DUF2332 domain-containing protein [Amycolatopsis acidiphila]GHG77915.1 hypothetical protein GCM10017788_44490 [Amycolatopsis acidiphila]